MSVTLLVGGRKAQLDNSAEPGVPQMDSYSNIEICETET